MTTSARCAACASAALTEVSMTMGNGQLVHFTSCRTCEHKSWRSGEKELSLKRVKAIAGRRK